MSRNRVCDPCAIRKVRCDGRSPCGGCLLASFNCTRLRVNKKPGPKGPRKKTQKAVLASQRQHGLDLNDQREQPCASSNPEGMANTPAPTPSVQQIEFNFPGPPLRKVPLMLLETYLSIYHHRMYPVWPVVDKDLLLDRLLDADDMLAYALAAVVCAATILQLQLSTEAVLEDDLAPSSMVAEVEAIRAILEYQENPSVDILLISFFLHISYLLAGKQFKSTLHLRESITFAHLLGLHQESHYVESPVDLAQHHLRIYWLLFITERAHAVQHDLPVTMEINPALPALDPRNQPSLSAFTSLCNLFEVFHRASRGGHTRETLAALHQQLQKVPPLPRHHNDLQRADSSVTRQWMRLMLWKLAIPYVALSLDPAEDNLSFQFPIRVAQDVLSDLSAFSMDTLEAHGPGMEMKLFSVANALADVIICLPSTENVMRLHPQEHLVYLAQVLGNFRGGNRILLPILQNRLMECGLGFPMLSRVTDVTSESPESGRCEDRSNSDNSISGMVADDLATIRRDSLYMLDYLVEMPE